MSVLRRTLGPVLLLLLGGAAGVAAQVDSCVLHYEALSGGAASAVPDASGNVLLAYDQDADDDLVDTDLLDDVIPPYAPPGGWFVALSNPLDSGLFWARSDNRLIDPEPGTQTVFNLRLFTRFAGTAVDSVHLDWAGSCFSPPNVTVLGMTSCDSTNVIAADMRAVSSVGIGRSSSAAWDDEEICIAIGAKDDLVASVKLFLEGPYVAGKMIVPPAYEAEIPLDQPFADAVFDGTVLDFDSLQSVTSLPDSTVDWVMVTLRRNETPESTVAPSARGALLLANGSIVEADGSPLRFPGVAPGGYRLVARHRNHVDVMSADTLDLSDGIGSWDFTTDLAQAYNKGGVPMATLGGGVYGMFAGEGNADGFVTAPDFNDWNVETTAGVIGYRQADYNLDGFVTAPDFNLWNANTTAGAASQIPD